MSDKIIKSPKDVSVGDFVKLTDRDERGRYTHTGQVDDVTKSGWITINTFFGILEIKFSDEGELTHSAQPRGWKKFIKDPEKYKRELLERETKKDLAPEVKTQKQIIQEILEKNKKLKKGKLVQLLKKELPHVRDKTLKLQIDLFFLKEG